MDEPQLPSSASPLIPLLPHQHLALLRLREHLASLPDPRVPGRVLRRLDEVLLIALCALLSDQDSFTDMAEFARSQLPWLRTFMPLVNGAPSHDVFRNVFMALHPEDFTAILQQWCGHLQGRHVAIDGKTLCGSRAASQNRCAVHVLRAWVSDTGLSLGHLACAEKSNELEALPRLLETLPLQGAVVSIDAMGGHPHIAAAVQEAGADYVLALKANEKNALREVCAHFEQADALPAPPPDHLVHETVDRAHGRFERRVLTVSSQLHWFDKSWKWPGLLSVVRVQRQSWRHAGQSSEVLLGETHYYLSSLAPEPDASRLARLIRQHWSVENQCHYVLDVTFHEDDCQVRDRSAAQSLSLMRELAAKLLKAHPDKKSLRAKRKRAALDPAFRFDLLLLIPSLFGA